MISSEKIVVSNSTTIGSSHFEEEKDERMSTSSGEGSSSKSSSGASVAGSLVSSSSSSSFTSKKDEKKKIKTSKKDRRNANRFMGDGVIFKGKLIGVRNVPHPRGEKMAREALQELKMQKKTSGEHKQKITVSIALDGLQIKDDKTKVLLHLHPVHKISFISQDASDTRAFGYIYGSPENEHTFFAIKTEKAAQQIVMCMRDLFQIAYELKKDEIVNYRLQQQERQQQQQQQEQDHLASDPSSLETDGVAISSSDSPNCVSSNVLLDLKSIEEPKQVTDMLGPIDDAATKTPVGSDAFFSDPWGYLRAMSVEDQFAVPLNVIVTDKIDPFDPDAHQQTRPELVTIDNSGPFDISNHTAFNVSSNDPFNTSFMDVPRTPFVQALPLTMSTNLSELIVDDVRLQETTTIVPKSMSEDKYAAIAEICEIDSDLTSSSSLPSSSDDILPLNVAITSMRISESLSEPISSIESNIQLTQLPPSLPTSIFSDLDPLGKDRPFVDKKDFFYELKNPPKKVLKDLIAENGFCTTLDFNTCVDIESSPSPSQTSTSCSEDDLLTSNGLLPPPLPPPFHNRNHHGRRRSSTVSPASSLEDATMASCSSSSTTSSPIGEIFLPPPPPPRTTLTFPTICPPPVPNRQVVQITSPPIPIPNRRIKVTNTNSISSSSSSSWDSNHNGERWVAQSQTTTGITISNLPMRSNNKNSINDNQEISRNIKNSIGNPFGVDVFLTPTVGSIGQANIFQKEIDPFADDDFFATPHTGQQQSKKLLDNQGRSLDFKWTSDNQ